MEKGLVSVVITTYQREIPMLVECVESVLNQTYRPIEVLVVDDNKPDSPLKAYIKDALKGYADLKLIVHEQNQGAQRARNDGIKAARGEFVAFLDDDDIWLPQKLEKQLPLFKDPSVGLVYCMGYQSGLNVNEHRVPYDNSKHFHTECTHRSLLAFDDIGTTSQAVIRASCFQKVGLFDEALPARQDWEMWLRVTTAYRAVGVPEFLFVRRMHEDAVHISRSVEKAKKSYLIIYKKYKAEYKKDRVVRALGFWQMGSHPVLEGTWFRFKYRMLAGMTAPFVIIRRIRHGREAIKL